MLLTNKKKCLWIILSNLSDLRLCVYMSILNHIVHRDVFYQLSISRSQIPCSAVWSTSDSRFRGPWFDTQCGHILSFLLPWFKKGISQFLAKVCARSTCYNCLVGLSLPGKSVVRLSDRPNTTIAAYHGHKTIPQQQLYTINQELLLLVCIFLK